MHKNFIEASNWQIAQFRELIFQLFNLDDHIASTLIPNTNEQKLEKLSLRHEINRTQAKLQDAADWIDAVKTAYIRGVQDGHKFKEKE